MMREKRAEEPFRFCTMFTLVKLTGKRAITINDLYKLVEKCSDSAIYHHMFRGLRKQHFITGKYLNDFAAWVFDCLQEQELGEKLAYLDVREYQSIGAIRTELLNLMEPYRVPPEASYTKRASRPFHLCESVNIVIPTEHEAYTAAELADKLERVSHLSVYYHFIESRLRKGRPQSDFAHWLERQCGLGELASEVDAMDVHTISIKELHEALVGIIRGRRGARRKVRK